jgi:predicted dehydrogenase
MARLKVGIQGAGWVSGEHIKAYKNNPNCQVVAISSRKLSSAEKRAEEAGLTDVKCLTDYDALLKEVDMVSICTPQYLHADETVRAANAGKHVLCEKPIATSLEELKAMRDAVRKNKVKTLAGFVLRWNPLCETIKAMIADDFVGDVYYLEADYQHYLGSWWSGFEAIRSKKAGVSTMLLAGVHPIDVVRGVASRDRNKAAKITEVTSLAGGYRKERGEIGWDGLEVMLAKLDTGAIAKVCSNNDAIQPYTFPIQVFGDKGSIKSNRVWSPQKFPGQRSWVEIPTILPDSAEVSHHPFQGEIDHFINCILKDKESHCNIEDAVNTHEACFAALMSEAGQKPVKLPLLS